MKSESKTCQSIIFTDLDGTLLDRETYSFQNARAALHAARQKNVPVVLCSSKTRAEQIEIRRSLGLRDPFIVEDGGAIFIEKDYFSYDFTYHREVEEFYVFELGTAYDTILLAIDEIRESTGIDIKGYGDLTPDEVADLTGLEPAAAERAMRREYQETIVSRHSEAELEHVERELARHALRLSRGGRFYAISGRHDKGVAVELLSTLYRGEHGDVRLVGLGDSFNDLALFRSVDVPVLVQKQEGKWEDVEIPELIRAEGVGPQGWNHFVTDYVRENV
jgi:mannosyl-3-phosphoglycerate phosphatase family protein